MHKSPMWIENEKYLSEINKTLNPPSGIKTGKIGIFLPGKFGDLITATSVLKYADTLWPNKEIIWFCNYPAAESLRFSPISEIRGYPYPNAIQRGDIGDPNFPTYEGMEVDFNSNGMVNRGPNRLNQTKKLEFDLTKDLEDGYFPAPWMFMLEDRVNLDYPNCSRKIFGVDKSLPWHPCLYFSKEEREIAREFRNKLPYKKTVLLETVAESGHSNWHDDLTKRTMRVCREKWGKCNFIFASRTDSSRFFDDEGVVSCGNHTIRQTALINDLCDLFIGVSSAISVATSCWGSKPVPKIQYCGSNICSTLTMSIGLIELIACEKYAFPPLWDHTEAENVFENRLRVTIQNIG